MSSVELSRREVTGTLNSGTVMAGAIKTLAADSMKKLAKSKVCFVMFIMLFPMF